MRIAQVSPLYESVPPRLYGGTERVVSYLTEELVARGHEVTLFAAGDSVTSAQLIPCCPQALRLDPACRDPLAYHCLMFERVIRERDRFDLIHFHTDYLHFSVARHLRLPHLTTLHGRLDLPELQAMYREFDDTPVVSISRAQRQPLPRAHWIGTVHHGLPPDLFPLREEAGDYLAFLGRISPEKGLDHAIEIATRVGMVLRVAAKVDRADRDYYIRTIAPLLHHPYVEFVGEITQNEKADFLGGAAALLFPVEWPEPFGLVLIEAMACGTPVIAFRRGSVPELVLDGETGFIVDDTEQAVAAVKRLPALLRRRCREVFDAKFTAARMANEYVALFGSIVDGQSRAAGLMREGASLWTNSSAFQTSTPSSPPRPGVANEPAY